jgi:hypothetical protein
MKEDRLALSKAVDSGDTDLGMVTRLLWLICCSQITHVASLPCLTTLT